MFSFLRSAIPESLRDLATPELFKVVPGIEILDISKKLLVSPSQFRLGMSKSLLLILDRNSCEIVERLEPGAEISKDLAELLLTLYFQMVLVSDVALMDLSWRSFERRGERWAYLPNKAHWRWTPDFQRGIRQIYAGYLEGEDSTFVNGLRALGLEHARTEFVEHFGEVRTGEVAFSFRHFFDSFQSVFRSHVKHGKRMNSELLPLGAMLTTLYRSLGRYDGKLDVKLIYRRAIALPPHDSL